MQQRKLKYELYKQKVNQGLRKEEIDLNREEQYEWFTFLCEKSDDEIVQRIKDDPCITTARMQFYTHAQSKHSNHVCSCGFYLERGQKPNFCTSSLSVKSLLDNCIKSGRCIHLQKWIKDLDKWNSRDVTMSPYNRFNLVERFAGFYWIHLILILGKISLLRQILTLMINYQLPEILWLTSLHKFTPFDLLVSLNHYEVIDDLLSYCGDLIPHEFLNFVNGRRVTTEHLTVLDTVSNIERVDILEKLLSHCHEKSYLSLSRAILNRKLKSARKFQKFGFTLDHVFGDSIKEVADKCIEQNDIEWFTCLLHCGRTASFVTGILQKTTEIGPSEFLKVLLNYLPKLKQKSTSRLHERLNKSLVSAVFLRDGEKTKLLLKHGADANTIHYWHNILFWAEVLCLSRICRLLKRAGGKFSGVETGQQSCLLSGVLLATVNTENNIRYLVEHGTNVNGKQDTAIPLFLAVRQNNYKVVEYLLQNECKLFEPDLFDIFVQHFYSARLLISFVKMNVNLSSEDAYSLIKLYSSKPAYLKFILSSCHTITQSDKRYLLNKGNDDDTERIVEDVLSVKSLVLCCRNSLRRHYGLRFTKYMNIQENNIPYELKDILKCREIIETFQMEIEEAREHHDSTNCICRRGTHFIIRWLP